MINKYVICIRANSQILNNINRNNLSHNPKVIGSNPILATKKIMGLASYG